MMETKRRNYLAGSVVGFVPRGTRTETLLPDKVYNRPVICSFAVSDNPEAK